MDKFWLKNSSAFQYSRQLTAEYSKSFYSASLLLPPAKRWATFAVYGYCRYADNLIDNPRNRSLRQIDKELCCFEDELKTAYQTGESEHPVLSAFVISARKYDIPVKYPLELLKGVEMDLHKKRYDSFDDLYLFCYRVAGVVGLMMTHVLGYKTKTAFPYAEKLGIALQLTNIVRDVKEDKNLGRIYLPRDEMKKFKVTEKDIRDERISANVCDLISFQVRRAHEYYEAARPGIALLHQESQFAIYAASEIYRGILYQMQNRKYNPFLDRAYVSRLKKTAIILKELFKSRTPFLRKKTR